LTEVDGFRIQQNLSSTVFILDYKRTRRFAVWHCQYTHTHARTHHQAHASKTFPLSANVRCILPSARGKTSTRAVCDTRTSLSSYRCVFYLKPFFVGNYLVKPICSRMNNSLNGRRREYMCGVVAVTAVIFFRVSFLYFSAIINAVGIYTRVIMRNETTEKKKTMRDEGEIYSCTYHETAERFRRMRKRIKHSGHKRRSSAQFRGGDVFFFYPAQCEYISKRLRIRGTGKRYVACIPIYGKYLLIANENGEKKLKAHTTAASVLTPQREIAGFHMADQQKKMWK
jgi:hypothetical protein